MFLTCFSEYYFSETQNSKPAALSHRELKICGTFPTPSVPMKLYCYSKSQVRSHSSLDLRDFQHPRIPSTGKVSLWESLLTTRSGETHRAWFVRAAPGRRAKLARRPAAAHPIRCRAARAADPSRPRRSPRARSALLVDAGLERRRRQRGGGRAALAEDQLPGRAGPGRTGPGVRPGVRARGRYEAERRKSWDGGTAGGREGRWEKGRERGGDQGPGKEKGREGRRGRRRRMEGGMERRGEV